MHSARFGSRRRSARREGQTQQIVGSAPVFLVADVVKAAEYYGDVLGFSYAQIWGNPPPFCMPKRDGFIVMLSQTYAPSTISPNGKIQGDPDCWDAYFCIEEADALWAEFTKKGATVVYEPVTRELYEMKELAIRDLDGYVLALGQHWPKNA